jgi:hypothetical protein
MPDFAVKQIAIKIRDRNLGYHLSLYLFVLAFLDNSTLLQPLEGNSSSYVAVCLMFKIILSL